MKINSITQMNPHLASGGFKKRSDAMRRESAYERENLVKQNNNNQINTTIKMQNSDGRVSFKGGVPLLHRAANFASDNPLVAEALFAILITCGARPITIMATAKNEEDKEKCSYQAAKSISSGLVGLAMTALVGTPIAAATKYANGKGAFNMPPEMKEQSQQVVKKGVDALTDFAGKLANEGSNVPLLDQIKALTEGGIMNLSIFKKAGKGAEKAFGAQVKEQAPEIYDTVMNAIKEQRIINNYARTGKNVMDKFFQPVFMPLRATITIALVPVLLGLIGLKKPEKKPAPQHNPEVALNYNVFQTTNEKEIFQSFSGVTSNANK